MAQSPNQGQNPDQPGQTTQPQNRRSDVISRYRPSDSILCGDALNADAFLAEYSNVNRMYVDLPVPIIVGYGEISTPCYQGDGVILITPLWSKPLVELLHKLNENGIKAVRLSYKTNRPMLVVPYVTLSTDKAYEIAKRVWDMRDVLSKLLDDGVTEYNRFISYDRVRDDVIMYFQMVAGMYLNIPTDTIFAPRRPVQQPQAN